MRIVAFPLGAHLDHADVLARGHLVRREAVNRHLDDGHPKPIVLHIIDRDFAALRDASDHIGQHTIRGP